jgi:hypothetical protein
VSETTSQPLSRKQIDILRHTENRAAGGLYCGGGADMDALVAAGLMQSAGRKSFVPDEYFRITTAGRKTLKELPTYERTN